METTMGTYHHGMSITMSFRVAAENAEPQAAGEAPLDTNHVERALRPIAPGRRNGMFCWSEVGARDAGVARVAGLPPRLWKHHFADIPMRSDV